jgi:hypothetical protein
MLDIIGKGRIFFKITTNESMKGGTSILVIPSWAKLVTRYGTFWGNLV